MGLTMGAGCWGGWVVMLVLWLLPFALLFFAIRFFFAKFKKMGDKTALEILEATYARGEIKRDEFLQKRDDLQKSR